jgi:hypothetical protein
VWSPSRTGRITGEMSMSTRLREPLLLALPFFDGESDGLLRPLSDGHTPLKGLFRMTLPYGSSPGPSLNGPFARERRKVPIGIRSQRLRLWRWRSPSSVAQPSGSWAISWNCPKVVDASAGSESRIEVSRTSSKRMGSASKLGEVKRVGSSDRLGSPRGVDGVTKDA